MIIELAKEWQEALLCAAASGDSKAAKMYDIAYRIAEGIEANSFELIEFGQYIEKVERLANS